MVRAGDVMASGTYTAEELAGKRVFIETSYRRPVFIDVMRTPTPGEYWLIGTRLRLAVQGWQRIRIIDAEY